MVWFFGKKGKEEKKDFDQMPRQNPSIEPATASSVTPDKKYRVRFEWKKCIGSGVCEAVAPAHFKVENGKAMLLGSKLVDEENKIYEKEIGEEELDSCKMASDGCPPNCIRVINIQTGEEIAPKK